MDKKQLIKLMEKYEEQGICKITNKAFLADRILEVDQPKEEIEDECKKECCRNMTLDTILHKVKSGKNSWAGKCKECGEIIVFTETKELPQEEIGKCPKCGIRMRELRSWYLCIDCWHKIKKIQIPQEEIEEIKMPPNIDMTSWSQVIAVLAQKIDEEFKK